MSDGDKDEKLRKTLMDIRGFSPFINGARVASIFCLTTLLIKKFSSYDVSSYGMFLGNSALVFGVSVVNDYFVFEYEFWDTKNHRSKINVYT